MSEFLSENDILSRYSDFLLNMKENNADVHAWLISRIKTMKGFDSSFMDFLKSLSLKSARLFEECYEGFSKGLGNDYLRIYYEIYQKHSDDESDSTRQLFLECLSDLNELNIPPENIDEVLEKADYDYDEFMILTDSDIYSHNLVNIEAIDAFIQAFSEKFESYKGRECFIYYISLFNIGKAIYGGLPKDIFEYFKSLSDTYMDGQYKFLFIDEMLFNTFSSLMSGFADTNWYEAAFLLNKRSVSTKNNLWINCINIYYSENIDSSKIIDFLNKHENLEYPYIFIRFLQRLSEDAVESEKTDKSDDSYRIDEFIDSLDNASYKINMLSESFESSKHDFETLINKYKDLSKDVENLQDEINKLKLMNTDGDFDSYHNAINSLGGYVFTPNNEEPLKAFDAESYFNVHSNDSSETVNEIDNTKSNIINNNGDNNAVSSDNNKDNNDVSHVSDNSEDNGISKSPLKTDNGKTKKDVDVENKNGVKTEKLNGDNPGNDFNSNYTAVTGQAINFSDDDISLFSQEVSYDSDGNEILSVSSDDNDNASSYDSEMNGLMEDDMMDYKHVKSEFPKKINLTNNGSVYYTKPFKMTVGQTNSVDGNSFFDRMARHILYMNFVKYVKEDDKLKSIYGFIVNDSHFDSKCIYYIGKIAETKKISLNDLFKFILKFPSAKDLEMKLSGLNE